MAWEDDGEVLGLKDGEMLIDVTKALEEEDEVEITDMTELVRLAEDEDRLDDMDGVV